MIHYQRQPENTAREDMAIHMPTLNVNIMWTSLLQRGHKTEEGVFANQRILHMDQGNVQMCQNHQSSNHPTTQTLLSRKS